MNWLAFPQMDSPIPVVKLNPNLFHRNKTLYDLAAAKLLPPCIGSIGCFISYEGTNYVWGVTSGHLFVERGECRCQEGDCIVTQPQRNPMMRMSDSYFALMKHTKLSGVERFGDVGLFQLSMDAFNKLKQDCKFKTQRPPFQGYKIEDKRLLSKHVQKTGQKTLNTTGKIIDVDVSFYINHEMRCGMFVVVSTRPRGHFACKGDSGAAVVDMDNGVVLGFVTAILETEEIVNPTHHWRKYESVTFCVHLDHVLQFVRKCEKEVNCSCQRTDTENSVED